MACVGREPNNVCLEEKLLETVMIVPVIPVVAGWVKVGAKSTLKTEKVKLLKAPEIWSETPEIWSETPEDAIERENCLEKHQGLKS